MGVAIGEAGGQLGALGLAEGLGLVPAHLRVGERAVARVSVRGPALVAGSVGDGIICKKSNFCSSIALVALDVGRTAFLLTAGHRASSP